MSGKETRGKETRGIDFAKLSRVRLMLTRFTNSAREDHFHIILC